ncbi:pyridoxamine 5'-phosphate oxidase family protein [Streptomyces sp. NPDC001595]|uniref:pyridoxamine 5'-phosphate oxidase family protein n=1 Tax=Streptomyces sp. NPDC001532 TaxID=3154520 RepID=UPI0033349A60
MLDHTASTGTAPPPTASAPGDLGRRLRLRRAELGLTLRETADRAGMAPAYLRYLEEAPAVTPGRGALLRLAAALRTTATALCGGDVDRPAGQGQASHDPVLRTLGAEECRRRLSTHGVGRLAVSAPEGPAVVPVNYSVVDGLIVYRTAPGTTPAVPQGTRVAFEVDHLDAAFGRGWSVLVRGHAGRVTDPEAARRLAVRAHSMPWAGGAREVWMCVVPTEITGRAVEERDAQEQAAEKRAAEEQAAGDRAVEEPAVGERTSDGR